MRCGFEKKNVNTLSAPPSPRTPSPPKHQNNEARVGMRARARSPSEAGARRGPVFPRPRRSPGGRARALHPAPFRPKMLRQAGVRGARLRTGRGRPHCALPAAGASRGTCVLTQRNPTPAPAEPGSLHPFALRSARPCSCPPGPRALPRFLSCPLPSPKTKECGPHPALNLQDQRFLPQDNAIKSAVSTRASAPPIFQTAYRGPL